MKPAKLRSDGKDYFFYPKKGILIDQLTLRLLRTKLSPRGRGRDQYRGPLGFFCVGIMNYSQPERKFIVQTNYMVEI